MWDEVPTDKGGLDTDEDGVLDDPWPNAPPGAPDPPATFDPQHHDIQIRIGMRPWADDGGREIEVADFQVYRDAIASGGTFKVAFEDETRKGKSADWEERSVRMTMTDLRGESVVMSGVTGRRITPYLIWNMKSAKEAMTVREIVATVETIGGGGE